MKKRYCLFILIFAVAFGLTACTMESWRMWWHERILSFGSFVEEEGGGEQEDESSHCFSADTLVLVEGSMKSISAVHVGDRIMTLDESGNVKLGAVARTYQVDSNHYYLLNGKIKVTGLHQFLTPVGWKQARDLQPGDKIQTSQRGGFEEIHSKERISLSIKVYNLVVAGNHTFLISPDGKSAYLVHNKSKEGNGNGD